MRLRSPFVPVEVVGAFRVPLLPVIHQHPIGLDAAVGADDDGAIAFAFGGVDTLGDIHHARKAIRKLTPLMKDRKRFKEAENEVLRFIKPPKTHAA